VRLRRHQEEVDRLCRAIAAGAAAGLTDILAAVTPGGGKSALPVIAAARLLGVVSPSRKEPLVERVCWVVPRDTLRRQAEEAFVDPAWRTFLGHGHAVRAAENGPDPCRGLAGYITTYQALAAAPELHLAEFRRHRYLLCVDELHHLPALSDLDQAAEAAEDTAWSRALLPLLETAGLRLLMTGTLERADRRPILWLGYRRDRLARRLRRVDAKAPGLAVVGYDRRAALAERAIVPVRFGALDGEAEWLCAGERLDVASFADAGDQLRPMLFTALRTGYADDLLRMAFLECRRRRASRRKVLGLPPGGSGLGLGKLLVVAPDQGTARRYAATLRGWLGDGDMAGVALAISDERHAVERIARFRLLPEPAILVTVGMAYEGMDAPEVKYVACLTQVRSVPWLEQMIARATRFDPHGGDYEGQAAVVYHPDDPLFRRFRRAVEADQSGRARAPRGAAGQEELPLPDPSTDQEPPPARIPLLPLRSAATDLRFETIQPRGRLAMDPALTPLQGGLLETPSHAEQRLRRQIGQIVATQVVEDAGTGRAGRLWGYHAYNAVLKRVLGKARAAMTVAELEAAVGWLERNRVADHLDLLRDDHRYEWIATRRQRSEAPRRTMRSRTAAPGGNDPAPAVSTDGVGWPSG
jgi:superfamily II DNA or RNA helicase